MVQLSGVDYLVVGPRVLKALGEGATLEGYNDGLSATVDEAPALVPALSVERAGRYEFSPVELEEVTGEFAVLHCISLYCILHHHVTGGKSSPPCWRRSLVSALYCIAWHPWCIPLRVMSSFVRCVMLCC